MTDKSYMTTKTPAERKQFVLDQIAAGNPKYIPFDKWIAANKEIVGINNLEKKVDLLTEIVMKLSKSQSK
jgi:hypothetical protein